MYDDTEKAGLEPRPLRNEDVKAIIDIDGETGRDTEWIKADNVKAGLLHFLAAVESWANDKREMKVCDLKDLMLDSFWPLFREEEIGELKTTTEE